MSQKKVDQYKEYKKNKEKILKKEKRVRRIEYGVIVAICCVFIGWFGYSVYDSATHTATSDAEVPTAVEVDMNAYADYVSGLQTSFSD